MLMGKVLELIETSMMTMKQQSHYLHIKYIN